MLGVGGSITCIIIVILIIFSLGRDSSKAIEKRNSMHHISHGTAARITTVIQPHQYHFLYKIRSAVLFPSNRAFDFDSGFGSGFAARH